VLSTISWLTGNAEVGPVAPFELPPVILGFQTDVGVRLFGGNDERVPFSGAPVVLVEVIAAAA